MSLSKLEAQWGPMEAASPVSAVAAKAAMEPGESPKPGQQSPRRRRK